MDMETIFDALARMNPWWTTGVVPELKLKDFKRDAYFQVRGRLNRNPEKAILLRGPRRVGKTVLAHQIIADYLSKEDPRKIVYVSYDRPDLRDVQPEIILDAMRGISGTSPFLLVVDEIQYLRDWDQWLKVLVDQGTGARILATGSSSLALKRGKEESGVGRWSEVLMFPMSFAEFVEFRVGESLKTMPYLKGEPFPREKVSPERWVVESRFLNELFNEYIQKGGFPGTLEKDPVEAQEELMEVLDRAIFKDIAALAGKREPMALEALVYYLSEHPGCIMVTERLSAELGIQRSTLEDYLYALEDMMLIIKFPNLKGKQARHKVYLADTGLLCALRDAQFGLLDDSLRGPLLETVVAVNLRYFCWDRRMNLFYWRFKDWEIDFVLTRQNKPFIAVEVGSGAKKLSGVSRFSEEYGIGVRIMGLVPPKKLPEKIFWVPVEIDLYRAAASVREASRARLMEGKKTGKEP